MSLAAGPSVTVEHTAHESRSRLRIPNPSVLAQRRWQTTNGAAAALLSSYKLAAPASPVTGRVKAAEAAERHES